MMELIVKHFTELSTSELYEILKTRFEIFVTEQECLYQDLDDKDQDAIHVFCWNEAGRVAGCLRVFWKDHDVSAGMHRLVGWLHLSMVKELVVSSFIRV